MRRPPGRPVLLVNPSCRYEVANMAGGLLTCLELSGCKHLLFAHTDGVKPEGFCLHSIFLRKKH